jgi:hypothetical protein
MKNTEKMTISEFKNFLMNWNFGAQPVSLQYVTEPNLTAEGKRKFGEVTKIANIGAMVGYSYENSRNNELERANEERDFISQPLWKGKGKRLTSTLSTHIEKGTFYLTYKAQKTFRSFHFDSVLNLIPNDLIKMYFPDKKPVVHNGIETKVYPRELLLENLKRFKYKGKTIEIVASK